MRSFSTPNFCSPSICCFDQLDRKGRCDDRRVVPVGQLRDGTDVVEVAVRRDDGLHVALEVAHDPVVGNSAHIDQVEAVHPFGFDVVVDQNL